MSDKRIDKPDELSFIQEITKNIPSNADTRRNTYVLMAGILAGKAIKNAKSR
jgi:hypothetical protein